MSQPLLLVGDSESNQDLYYKTHFLAGDPFVYLENGSDRLLVVGPFERGRAEKEGIVPTVKTFDDFGYNDLLREGMNRSDAFSTVLERIVTSVSTNAVTVPRNFPLGLGDGLRSRKIELALDGDAVSLARRQKSPDEIAAMERVQQATERAVECALELLRQSDESGGVLHVDGTPLTAERLRLEMAISLLREGADAGTPIVAGGPGAADPHWTGAGPLRAGEAIVIDIFPRDKSSRYFADMTRTVVRGEPKPILVAMYDATLEAQEAAFSEIRAGANGKDVHAAVNAIYQDAGFGGDSGPRLVHGTGHGLGLEVHEAPHLGITDMELLEGDVVTVEPGLYDPEIGGVRIEDVVVVTADGYRNLTRFPKSFRI